MVRQVDLFRKSKRDFLSNTKLQAEIAGALCIVGVVDCLACSCAVAANVLYLDNDKRFRRLRFGTEHFTCVPMQVASWCGVRTNRSDLRSHVLLSVVSWAVLITARQGDPMGHVLAFPIRYKENTWVPAKLAGRLESMYSLCWQLLSVSASVVMSLELG